MTVSARLHLIRKGLCAMARGSGGRGNSTAAGNYRIDREVLAILEIAAVEIPSHRADSLARLIKV